MPHQSTKPCATILIPFKPLLISKSRGIVDDVAHREWSITHGEHIVTAIEDPDSFHGSTRVPTN